MANQCRGSSCKKDNSVTCVGGVCNRMTGANLNCTQSSNQQMKWQCNGNICKKVPVTTTTTQKTTCVNGI
jgi:hypothetical protein